MRETDWSRTSLGPVSSWPTELRSTAELVLACKFPMILLWGPELVQIYNDAYAVIMGAKHPQGMGQPTKDCWPEVWSFNEPIYRRVFKGETLTFENQLFPITRHGFLEEAYFSLCYSPLRFGDDAASIAGVLVTVFETTQQIKAEAAEKQVQQDLQNMIDSTPQISWAADPEGEVVHFGKQWAEVTGLDPLRTQSEERYSVVHPEDLPGLQAAWQHSVSNGEHFDIELRMLSHGSYRWMRSRARARRDENGAIARWYGTTEDIHARKEAEAELRTLAAKLQEQQEQLKLALHATRASAFNWQLQPDFIHWTAGRPFGRSPEELSQSEDAYALIQNEDRPRVRQVLQEALAGKHSYSVDYCARWPDESIHWIRSTAVIIRDDAGQPTRIIGIDTDITEDKVAEQALLRTEKLAAVGRLASSIAHEINNPLESVTNLLYLAGGSKGLEEAQNYINVAERELRRAAEITNQTLRFHKQATRPTLTTAAELLGSVLTMQQGRLVNSRVEVFSRHESDAPILCFEGEVRQVLNNLVGNAIDAMHGSNRCHLVLRSRKGRDGRTGQEGIQITVSDTGKGMSPATAARIFDPFFTTKGIGGTGLGLWVSTEIVQRHAGRLTVRSSQGKKHHGTVFRLFLPFDAVTR